MRKSKRATAGTLLAIGAALLFSPQALAAVAHTIQPGETLSGIAAANGLSADSLAAYNGLSADTYVIAGQTIEVPYPGEVATSTTATTTTTTTTTPTTTTTASAAGHTVAAGESLYGIAAANGVSPDALAAANGLSIDSVIVPGQTLQVPAATTVATTPTTTTTAAPTTSTTTTSASTSGLAPIYCPCGTDYLSSSAATEWDAMRQDALANYGVDLYPNGSLSAYRTYSQQAYLYQQYLDGTGAPANPPGTSPHELGDSVDLATPEMRTIVDSIGAQFGWGKIYGPTEWWHVDYLG